MRGDTLRTQTCTRTDVRLQAVATWPEPDTPAIPWWRRATPGLHKGIMRVIRVFSVYATRESEVTDRSQMAYFRRHRFETPRSFLSYSRHSQTSAPTPRPPLLHAVRPDGGHLKASHAGGPHTGPHPLKDFPQGQVTGVLVLGRTGQQSSITKIHAPSALRARGRARHRAAKQYRAHRRPVASPYAGQQRRAAGRRRRHPAREPTARRQPMIVAMGTGPALLWGRRRGVPEEERRLVRRLQPGGHGHVKTTLGAHEDVVLGRPAPTTSCVGRGVRRPWRQQLSFDIEDSRVQRADLRRLRWMSMCAARLE